MSGATMVRLPATRVRVGESFAGGCFAVLPIALFDALPLFFFVSDCVLASAAGSPCSESCSPSELLVCPSAV